jgi:hypothetical protein
MIKIKGIDEIYLTMRVIFNHWDKLGSKEQRWWVEEKEVARLEETPPNLAIAFTLRSSYRYLLGFTEV